MIFRDRFKQEEGLRDFTEKLCPEIDKVMKRLFPEFTNPQRTILDLMMHLFGQPFVFLQMGPFLGTQALHMEWTRPTNAFPEYVNKEWLGDENEVDFVTSLFLMVKHCRKENDGSVIELGESNGCSVFLYPEHDICLKVINKVIAPELHANGVT